MGGLANMGASYALAGLGHKLGSPRMAAGSILLSAVAYQATVAPLSWIIPTEIFPQDMRCKGSTMSSTVYAGTVQALLQVHPLLAQSGVVTFLATYTGSIVVTGCLHRVLQPETVGRSLEEIERDVFSRRLWRRGSMAHARESLGLVAPEEESPQEASSSSVGNP